MARDPASEIRPNGTSPGDKEESGRTTIRPGPDSPPSATSTACPRTAAARRRIPASPYTTGRQTETTSGNRRSCTTISGPPPAGAPIVTAILGRIAFPNAFPLLPQVPEDPFDLRVVLPLVLQDDPARPFVEIHAPEKRVGKLHASGAPTGRHRKGIPRRPPGQGGEPEDLLLPVGTLRMRHLGRLGHPIQRAGGLPHREDRVVGRISGELPRVLFQHLPHDLAGTPLLHDQVLEDLGDRPLPF